MKSIIGIGNALTDILVVLPDDSLLKEYKLPEGSMQWVSEATCNELWEKIKNLEVECVAGGSAANTITGAAALGMRCGFIGKVGADELGGHFEQAMRDSGIAPRILLGKAASGRAMVFITPPRGERTFADYLGAAMELGPDDLKREYFEGYHYLHIEGYLVQNHALVQRVVEIGKELDLIISLDLASYNVVESNNEFLHKIVENYIDIVFANEAEAKAFTGKAPIEAISDIAKLCKIAVVKVGPQGSMVGSGSELFKIAPKDATPIDATGAGDLYAAGFLYSHSQGYPLDICGEIGSLTSSKIVEVIGPKLNAESWGMVKKEIEHIVANAKM